MPRFPLGVHIAQSGQKGAYRCHLAQHFQIVLLEPDHVHDVEIFLLCPAQLQGIEGILEMEHLYRSDELRLQPRGKAIVRGLFEIVGDLYQFPEVKNSPLELGMVIHIVILAEPLQLSQLSVHQIGQHVFQLAFSPILYRDFIDPHEEVDHSGVHTQQSVIVWVHFLQRSQSVDD